MHMKLTPDEVARQNLGEEGLEIIRKLRKSEKSLPRPAVTLSRKSRVSPEAQSLFAGNRGVGVALGIVLTVGFVMSVWGGSRQDANRAVEASRGQNAGHHQSQVNNSVTELRGEIRHQARPLVGTHSWQDAEPIIRRVIDNYINTRVPTMMRRQVRSHVPALLEEIRVALEAEFVQTR